MPSSIVQRSTRFDAQFTQSRFTSPILTPARSVITHNHPRAFLNWKINQDFSFLLPIPVESEWNEMSNLSELVCVEEIRVQGRCEDEHRFSRWWWRRQIVKVNFFIFASFLWRNLFKKHLQKAPKWKLLAQLDHETADLIGWFSMIVQLFKFQEHTWTRLAFCLLLIRGAFGEEVNV